MLYERWLEVVRDRGGERALTDAGSGRTWTFRQLRAEAESRPEASDRILFPRGNDSGFILTLLNAWRAGRPVCPLEPGQPIPEGLQVPPGIDLLKTTSATTGTARFVMFTAEQLAADADAIVRTMGLDPAMPNLGVISLAHSYGFSNLALPLLLHGIPLVLAPSALPEVVRRTSALGSDWTLPAVPALWRAWHDAGAIPGSVRLALSAGAPLPLALEKAVFDRWSIKIHNFLGATECGGIAFDAAPGLRDDVGLAGTPLAGASVSVEERCLVVRGPAVGAGYWPEPSPRLGSGVFRTSDLAEIRGQTVYLRGRMADLINVAGRKADPAAIEEALLGHEHVRECLVLGIPARREEDGDAIAAVLVLRKPATVSELRRFMEGRVPAWQIPRQWHFVDSLGFNARGKLSRADWRRRLEGSLDG